MNLGDRPWWALVGGAFLLTLALTVVVLMFVFCIVYLWVEIGNL